MWQRKRNGKWACAASRRAQTYRMNPVAQQHSREAMMTLSTKVGYAVTCLAFLFVGAITFGVF